MELGDSVGNSVVGLALTEGEAEGNILGPILTEGEAECTILGCSEGRELGDVVGGSVVIHLALPMPGSSTQACIGEQHGTSLPFSSLPQE